MRRIAAEHIIATGNKDKRWTDVYLHLEEEVKTAVDALQAIIKQMGEQAAVIAKDGMAAKAQLSQLKALVRALPVPEEGGFPIVEVDGDYYVNHTSRFSTKAEADAYTGLLAYRATLDASRPAVDALTPLQKGERMTHEELVRRIAKSGQEIKDSLSAKDLDLWHHATGVATEAGELLDAAKKVAIYNKPVDRENVIEELGDLEFYMQGIRANLGITREECLAHNIAKLTKRYPKGTFDNADAVARADKHGEQDH